MDEENSKFNPLSAIYTPQQSSMYAVQTVKRVQAGATTGLSLGLPGISPGYVPPVLPGQVAVILGQTSHYKSGMLHFIERRAAEQLVLDGREDEILVHISVEEGIEEQVYQQMAYKAEISAGRIARGDIQDWNKLEEAALWVGQIPIYRIGDSIARAEEIPNLYLSNMLRCLRFLRDELMGKPMKLAGVFVDYLQAFPIDPEVRMESLVDQRRLQVREDFYRLRVASREFNCPFFVGVQAKQKLNEAPGPNMLIPGVYDAEETSAIGQRADRQFALWLPKQTHSVGTTIEHKGLSFLVEEDLLWFKVNKQRGGLPAGRSWPLRVDYVRNRLAVLETSQLTTPQSFLEYV